MTSVKVLENIYWVGALDWNIRTFHGFTYSTHRGTTYNAYLIVDGRTALIDTVHPSFTEEMIQNIREVIDPSKIDYIVANHVETDHSGAISEVLKLAKKAKIIGTAKCQSGLQKHYFGDWDFQVAKTGDEVSLGDKTLKFIEAPLLHWPDSMFTYIEKDKLLLPNDAFGQHWATSKRFDDEVNMEILMDEATKYYANILWPFSGLVLKRILVVYDTMWGSTEKMAKAILDGIMSEGVEVLLFRLPFSDRGDIMKELLDSKGLILGSSTINNGILPTMAPFLEELQGLRPKNKIAAVFGSYGWGGGAVKVMEEKLGKAGIEVTAPGLTVKWVPSEDELKRCFEFGRDFALQIKRA